MSKKIEFEVDKEKLLMGYSGWFCGFKGEDIQGYFTFPNKQEGLTLFVDHKKYKVTIEPVEKPE